MPRVLAEAPTLPDIQIEEPVDHPPASESDGFSELSPEPPSVPEPQPGELIADRYRVIEKIARGGMASVYRVEHTHLRKHMALKLLHAEQAILKPALDRFLREARSAAQLDDPNIVRVIDFGLAENDRPFLVMELLHGVVLTEVLRNGDRLPLGRIIEVIDQILSGLSHAHDNQLIHRDIKPDNVMLISRIDQLLVKILDFGIAKPTVVRKGDSWAELTNPGAIFGTVHYMSPEQALGEGIDHRTDLYSTGVILYELLSGRVPFGGGNIMKVLSKTLNDPPEPIDLSAYGTQLRRMLEGIVFCALEKEKQLRFPSARAFRDALRDCLPLIPPD